MQTTNPLPKFNQHRGTWLSFIMAIVLTFAFAQSLYTQPGTDDAKSDLDASTLSVNRLQANPGETLVYQIIVHNDGDIPATDVTISDTLPTVLTYQPETLTVVGEGVFSESNGVITWSGTVPSQEKVEITFAATLSSEIALGTEVQNIVHITWQDQQITRTANTLISGGNVLVYLPLLSRDMNAPIMNTIERPNSNNQWTVSWQANNIGTFTYELQEANDPGFSTILNTYTINSGTSKLITQTPGLKNVFYYRVRAVAHNIGGPWSNVESIIGGYRDDFSNNNSGWSIRRTTFIEEVRSWYENGNFIFQVEDRWDWGIASPLAPAPEPPYAIEYRSQPAHLGNLISHGAVFGGDFPGAICPDFSTPGGVYEHNLCFNHFYNTNTIWYGPLKLAFERVDYLFWCPSCGGSAMKRLTNDPNSWFIVQPIPNVDSSGWNTWRIEVRNTGLTFYVNGDDYAQSNDTTWVNDPYFGVFGSTDEYNNSTWRYDYYQVTPLDN